MKNKEISIQHSPTEEMLTDVFKKPLQGSLFLKLQTAIMGHGPPSHHKEDHRSVLHNNDTNSEAPDSEVLCSNDTISEAPDSNLEPNLEPLAPEPTLPSNAICNANLASPNHGHHKWTNNKPKHKNKCRPPVMA